MNICEHLTATARLFPEREALYFEGAEFTYSQLDRLSLAAAEQLLVAGVEPGDRVAIMLPNVPAFVVWYYAALRIGAIAVSVSTRSTASELGFIADDCDAKVCVLDEANSANLQPALPACIQTSVTTSALADRCNGQPLDASTAKSTWVDRHPNDAALILYTSGTTGFAKGATLSHINVRSNVHAFNHLCDMQSTDRILLAVPLFHCFGQNALLNSALNVGATLVLQRRFDLPAAKRLIAQQQVTQLYGVPMMFQLFLDSCERADLASVRYCFSAAATLPIQVSRQWQQKFGMPIHEGYGLTETSPFASYNHRLQFVPGSIGTPIDSVEMKIVDLETGADCLPGQLGEIAIRGPNVMLGYWNRAEDTQAALRDGWFHSGDIGRIDERGYFFIVDRVKDMIAIGGLKAYPAEIERVLLEHADVTEAAVVGVQNQMLGEQVVAFVVLSDHRAAPATDRLTSIREHAQEHLASYKVPRAIVPIDQLPRNAAGKVLKTRLRDGGFPEGNLAGVTTSESAPTPAPRQLREPTLREQLASIHRSGRGRLAKRYLQELVQTLSQSDELPDADARFLDVGLDSLSIVDLTGQLKLEAGEDHELSATLVFDHPRISDLGDYLVTLLTEDVRADPPPVSQADRRQEIESMSEAEAQAELLRELEG